MGHGDQKSTPHSMVGWHVQGFSAEEVSDPHFHEYLKAGIDGVSRLAGSQPILIACVEPKTGGDPVKFTNYTTYHSPPTERVADRTSTVTVTCEDGGCDTICSR